MNHYVHRDLLKAALSLQTTATDKHVQLDAVAEGVCREIDRYVGAQFYPSSGVRHYRPRQTTQLDLDYPLLSLDSVLLDTDGDATYESTLPSSVYYLTPDNATLSSPREPFWALEIPSGAGASAVFPVGVARGAKLTGTWGWYDERTETTAKPATAITAAQTIWDMAGASNLHPGQTIRVDAEQIYIERNGISGSDTATSSGQITVRRAQNGTTGATHSSLSTMSYYDYPIVDRAALYQAEMDYRAQDAPLGVAGSELTAGGLAVRAPGGLHPFVRRLLDHFRTPVAL